MGKRDANFEELQGAVILAIYENDEKIGKYYNIYDYEESLIFVTDKGVFVQYHNQECCENVSIEDICGDLEDLIGNPVLVAEERSNSEETGIGDKEWTFYELATIKGSVNIRWYGESNGYYSTSVSFVKIIGEQ